jgi:hypothetical protein
MGTIRCRRRGRESRSTSVVIDADTGAQVNCVDFRFCRTHNIPALLESQSLNLPQLVNPDGTRLKNHGIYLLSFDATDNNGNTRTVSQFFFGVRRPKGAAPLLWGNPGLGQESVTLHTGSMTFEFGCCSEVRPEVISRDIVHGFPAFTAVISNITLGPEDSYIESLDDVSSDTVDDQPLPPEIAHRALVFDEKAAVKLPTLEGAEHRIDLVDGAEPPRGTIYPLSQRQLDELAQYIQTNLANGRIVESSSPAGAPIIFVPKKDGSLRLCVDYRGLNKVTIKNRYPIPLISELMDRLSGARYFTRLDIRDAYHRIRIRKSDQWKTAFRTRYGQFEYTVMPFGLTNAPATFQAYINRALTGLIDDFCIVYLDDILIYSQTREEHTSHILQVLDRLEQSHLFVKQSKCVFYQDRVDFLGFIIDREGISMDPDRVKAVQEWPTPESVHDIQVFLGFANFYRRFISGYSRIASPITDLLKKTCTPFSWTEQADAAFELLKTAFSSAPILVHWNPNRPTRVETDASNKAISGILSQQVDSRWRPIAYWSRKLSDAELRWATGQKELLAIIESLEHWSHYLEGTDRKFVVLTDHQALKGVVAAPARDLRGRLARWVYRLAAFDFDIEHRPGKTNPADPLSRRPDYMATEITYQDVLPTLQAKLQMTAKLSESQRAVIAHLSAAGTKKTSCSRKYRRRVRRQCPRVHSHAGISAVTALPPIQAEAVCQGQFRGLDTGSATAPSTQADQMSSVEGRDTIASAHSMSSGAYREVLLDDGGVIVLDTSSATAPSTQAEQMSSVEGRDAIANAHSMWSGAYREVLLDDGGVIVLDTSSATAPSTQAESVEGRDAIANAHSMSSGACREVSPDAGGMLGQFNQDAEGQSQQTTRCVGLLIPHAVAAEICAGEAVDGNDSRCRFYHSIIALQKGDLECVQRTQQIDGDQHPRSKHDTVDDKGALRFKGRLVIPAVPAVRRELVRLHHDDPRAGHFGSRKTIELLKRRFHWENLDSDVQTYVSHCQICLGNRQPRHKPYGALSSLPLPTQPFEEISMDFITKLPPCQHKDRMVDAVLVIVDRFTKVALFVPTSATLTAAELAQLLYEHLECRFGTPLGIVSDRDSLLTSDFWTELSKARQMKQRLSTAYHPQTDGQTERTHQALQHYLRCFSGAEQQWAPLLPEAEFAYNNSVHVTIGVSPFEALYGYHPRMVDYVPSSQLKVQGVHERLSKLAQTRERMYVHWQKAVDSQKKYYDARHQWVEFQVGETVGLSTKNFRFKEGKKLAPRFIPVKVTERIGSQAYKVQLPVKYSRLHDVFPVSLLEKWYSGQDQKVLPLPELVDGEEEWEVEDIVDHKDVGDERRFLVKWAGWPAEYNTWEPREHFANAKRIITAYEKKARHRHRKWDDPDDQQ